MDQNESKMQIAVLIDSENVSSRYASIIFNEIETYGFATYRRIYGNWTKNNGWSENILLENSITPIQQFNYTSGKNSSDMTMVIDAMDILYSGNVDGFCLVTSDSDFTRLAMRLREANMYVIGMGESKTPAALTKACNKFIHLNLIFEASVTLSESQTAELHEDFSSDRSVKANAVTPIADIEEAIISVYGRNRQPFKQQIHRFRCPQLRIYQALDIYSGQMRQARAGERKFLLLCESPRNKQCFRNAEGSNGSH